MEQDRLPTDPHRASADDEKRSVGAGARLLQLLANEKQILEDVATGKPLQVVLDTLVRSIESRVEGTIASVLLLAEDGQTLVHGAAAGLPADYCRLIDGLRIGPRAGSCGTAAYRGERVVVDDVLSDPLWTDYRDLATRFGLRACWSQPILSSAQKVLGTLALYYRTPMKPSEFDLRYIEASAHIAGIAIERNVTERRRRVADQRLLKQKAVLVELAKSQPLIDSRFGEFARLATEVSAETLRIERVGIWLFNEDRSVLRLHDLYELSADRHSTEVELEALAYPRYFAALERGRIVVAHEARRDPDTSEFAEGYLTPLGITSMLDAPIRRSGQIHGVVCHEHVGPPRLWAADEQEFAATIGDFVALVLEAGDRRRAEQAFRSAQEDLLRRQWQARKQIEFDLDKAKGQLIKQTRLATVGQVAASVAHELRNPLAAIRNAIYVLKRDTRSSAARTHEYLEIVEQEIAAADRIVEHLLDASHFRDPERSLVDLGRTVLAAWRFSGDHSAVELSCDFRPDPFPVFADSDQLRQVLGNLLNNAVQSASASVRVAAHEEPGQSVITVEDDGPGIPEADRERIFEPLFTTRSKGTGLGLAICRRIVQDHGGSIEYVPRNGGGARFEVRFPEREDR